jgi:SLOG cluster2
MPAAPHPLAGVRVGISVGGSAEELARRGFTERGVSRFTVRLARALLADGAALAFGHDWREGGVMEAIASIAFDYRLPAAPEETEAPILNLLPWPATASATDPVLLSRLTGVVEVTPAGLPAELRALEPQAQAEGRRGDTWRYLRARGLTHLRRQLVERCQARVAIGGRLEDFDGRLPGIVEEVFLTCLAGSPVYLAGLLGGAAEFLDRAQVEGRPADSLQWATAFDLPGDLRPLSEIYVQHAQPSAHGFRDQDLDLPAVIAFLTADAGRAAIRQNGLTPGENLALFNTDLEEDVVHLVLQGLKRLAHRAQLVTNR